MHSAAKASEPTASKDGDDHWLVSLHYAMSFDETKKAVLEEVRQWYPHRGCREIPLMGFEASIALKNFDGVIIAENSAFRRLFTAGVPAIGRGADAFFDRRTAKMSQSTDQLIRDGAQQIEFEHVSGDSQGRLLTLHSLKFRLDELNDRGYFILAISRPIALVGKSERERERTLSELFGLFQQLDEIDQAICRQDANGDSTKDIAASVGLTSRSVEMRRKKMLDLFDVPRPMELIRITIRLEDHGLLL